MPLIPATMALDLISAVAGKTDPVSANLSLGNAIASHIKSNAQVMFSWTAALPSPPFTPDPVVVATGEISPIIITLSPSMASNYISAMSDLTGKIVTGMSAAMYNISIPGFSCTPGAMSSAPSVSTLMIAVSGATMADAMLKLATDICLWVQSLVPAAPVSGTHGSFVGTGTVTAIL